MVRCGRQIAVVLPRMLCVLGPVATPGAVAATLKPAFRVLGCAYIYIFEWHSSMEMRMNLIRPRPRGGRSESAAVIRERTTPVTPEALGVGLLPVRGQSNRELPQITRIPLYLTPPDYPEYCPFGQSNGELPQITGIPRY